MADRSPTSVPAAWCLSLRMPMGDFGGDASIHNTRTGLIDFTTASHQCLRGGS